MFPSPPRSPRRRGRPFCPARRPRAESLAACARRSYRPPRAWFSFAQPWVLLLTLLALVSCLGCGLDGRVLDLAQRRTPDDFLERPPLQLAQRPCLANAHHVAKPRRALLVVGIELLGRAHNALVLGMSLAHLDLDHDGLLHLGRNHLANLLVTPRPSCRRRLYCLCRRRHLAGSLLAGRGRSRIGGCAANAQLTLAGHGLDLCDLLAQLLELFQSCGGRV